MGTNKRIIYNNFSLILENEGGHKEMSHVSNPHGNEKARKRIANILEMML